LPLALAVGVAGASLRLTSSHDNDNNADRYDRPALEGEYHLETISITDESCPASYPNQGTGQLQQAQEIDGFFLVPDQEAPAL